MMAKIKIMLVSFLVLVSQITWAKTNMAGGPPKGLIFLADFASNTELESQAFNSLLTYLHENKENPNTFYLKQANLDLKTGLYSFQLIHNSSFRESRETMDESYKNGIYQYDFKSGEVTGYIKKTCLKLNKNNEPEFC